ncbi:MAG: hypothetical protein ABIP11_01985 [Luteimonas sp.]
MERLLVAGMVLLIVACYWPGLGGGYVFDDFPNIVGNNALHVTFGSGWRAWMAAAFSSPASELQRPLAMLTFALNIAVTGVDPYWMKFTNVGIHALNAWLVYRLTARILQATATPAESDLRVRRERIALWVAAAWALNPINLMAVLFVVQRMESLSHTFVFGGLWLYLAGRARLGTQQRGGWGMLLGGLVGGTLLGLLSKESAVLLPLYALLLEWALLGFAHQGKRDRRLPVVYLMLLVVPGLAGMAWKAPGLLSPEAWAWRSFTLPERLLTEGRVLVDYLHWTLLPDLSRLSLYHDDFVVSHGLLSPPSTLFAMCGLAALLVLAGWLRTRRPMMALGLAWFFAAHLLTATFIPLELVYEHRNYFASLGLCIALGDLLLRLPTSARWRMLGQIVAIALLAMYTGLTALRASEWSSPLQFSINEASKHPGSPRATYDLARNLIVLTDYQRTSPHLVQARAAVEQAMAVANSSPLPEQAAIVLAERTGMPVPTAWWHQLQSKLRTRPVGPQETGAMAGIVDCEVKHLCDLPTAQMDNSFTAALAHGPNAEMMNIYGNYALNVRHNPTLALLAWRQSASLSPDVVQYQETLARMLIATGAFDEASAKIRNIRKLGRWGQNKTRAHELEASLVHALPNVTRSPPINPRQ